MEGQLGFVGPDLGCKFCVCCVWYVCVFVCLCVCACVCMPGIVAGYGCLPFVTAAAFCIVVK